MSQVCPLPLLQLNPLLLRPLYLLPSLSLKLPYLDPDHSGHYLLLDRLAKSTDIQAARAEFSMSALIKRAIMAALVPILDEGKKQKDLIEE